MAEEEKKEEGGEGSKKETKEEKKARKAREKEERKKAKAAKKAGATPEGEAGAEGEAAGGKKGKKKLIIIIAAAIVLLGGGGAALMLSGVLGGEDKSKTAELDALTKDQTLYHDMDELLVNLNNPGRQASFLKAVITLELPNQLSLNEVQAKMPRIRDLFQTYMRELRSSDLQGSAGLQRLRNELLLRVNNVMEKGEVNNILFKEIIVQ